MATQPNFSEYQNRRITLSTTASTAFSSYILWIYFVDCVKKVGFLLIRWKKYGAMLSSGHFSFHVICQNVEKSKISPAFLNEYTTTTGKNIILRRLFDASFAYHFGLCSKNKKRTVLHRLLRLWVLSSFDDNNEYLSAMVLGCNCYKCWNLLKYRVLVGCANAGDVV